MIKSQALTTESSHKHLEKEIKSFKRSLLNYFSGIIKRTTDETLF